MCVCVCSAHCALFTFLKLTIAYTENWKFRLKTACSGRGWYVRQGSRRQCVENTSTFIINGMMCRLKSRPSTSNNMPMTTNRLICCCRWRVLCKLRSKFIWNMYKLGAHKVYIPIPTQVQINANCKLEEREWTRVWERAYVCVCARANEWKCNQKRDG